MPEASIQPSCLLGQHDRNAAADGVGELGGARDQLLLLRIVFEWSLSQWADQNFQKLRINAARGAVGRVAHDVLQREWRCPANSAHVQLLRCGQRVDTPARLYHAAAPASAGNWGGGRPRDRPRAPLSGGN